MTAADILFVTGSLDIGGAERHLATLSPRLKALGWKPAIYCLAARGEQADEVEAAGVEVIGPPAELVRGRNRLLNGLALGLSCLKLFVVLLGRRPRFVHCFLPIAYMLGAPLAILARIPIRIMSRRSLNHYQKNHPTLR